MNGSTKGIVFDVQRASMHDGPGIRTTVFLKGCQLRCAWCHNPESQRRRPELGFDAAKCAGCRACAGACAQGVHAFDPAGRHLVAFDRCIAAGACVAACPSEALRLYGGETTVDEIMRDVVKDRAFYEASGGGLTLSGGEPTVQLAFCLALLRAAKAAGIHTCVETCGFAPRESFEALAPLTDLFLFDYKDADGARHAANTGVSNERILDNLRWLHGQGAAIVLRCPLVPGVNDDDAHLRSIGALRRELPRLAGVDLLPYHEAGFGKYERLGRPRPALGAAAPDAARQAQWRRAIDACWSGDSADPQLPT
jgi:pyruvate formate lyase activating enzyme